MAAKIKAELRAEILRLIRDPKYRPLDKIEITNALGYGAAQRNEVRRALRDLEQEGEIARINHHKRRVTFAHGDFVGDMPYDFLVLALGRRLATEQINGFFEHAHHLLGLDAAKKLEKNHEISEDDQERIAADVQKATDAVISEIDQMLAAKEKEILTV